MTADELLQNFRRCLVEHLPVDTALDTLLKQTGARAVGLWRVQENQLIQVGFRAVPDMPLEVQVGFASATAAVPLSNPKLGIVQAVLSREPTIATLDPQETGLTVSASWLARFGAEQSVAFPIFDAAQTVTGVLAISTPAPLQSGDETWQLMITLTAGLDLH